MTNTQVPIISGVFVEEDDEYTDFIPNVGTFDCVRYQDRVLLYNAFSDNEYNLLTGSDCEHYPCHPRPSEATKESPIGVVIEDSWGRGSWVSSNRLFVEKRVWDGISQEEKQAIQTQGWIIHVASNLFCGNE